MHNSHHNDTAFAMQELITSENVSVIRSGKAIVDKVSLSIGSGDFITIVGPNGAGKTTLLKVLMGILPPDNGKIVRKPNLKTGYVPQCLNPSQTMPITAKRFLSLRKKTIPAELEEISKETGINEKLSRPLHTLSGGELQRVLLARALIGNPDILILDEPAQNLDIAGQLNLYSLIDTIYRKRNLGIIMVSHDIHLVMSSTRHVVCMFHHISCSGKPNAIAHDPSFQSIFGEGFSKMMSVYTHTSEKDHDCETHDHSHHVHTEQKNKTGGQE